MGRKIGKGGTPPRKKGSIKSEGWNHFGVNQNKTLV